MTTNQEEKPRRRRIPGTGDLIKQIKEINDKIAVLNNSMQDCKNKIMDAIKEEKENSSKGKLIERKQMLFDDIKAIKEEREVYKAEKNKILPEFMKLKEILGNDKKKHNLKESRAQIQQKIERINAQIMSTRFTPQQEREFERELTDLKMKKTLTEGYKESEKELEILSGNIDSINKKIDETNKQYIVKQNEINQIKSSLDKMKDKKTKNPKIEENDAKITTMKKEKTELMDKRKKVQDQIKEKEVSYDLMLKENEKLMEQEQQRKQIKNGISEKEKSKNVFLKEIDEIDPSKFDIICNELKQVKQCNIPVSLFLTLTSVKLPVPKSEEEIQDLISRIKQEKETYQNNIQSKIDEIQEKIRNIDLEINKQKEELDKIPSSKIGIKPINLAE